jgi:hypothetical protein
MLKVVPILACLTIAPSTASLAGSHNAPPPPTDPARQACEPEANRLCKDFFPDRDRIIACMVEKGCQVHPDCRAYLIKDNPKLKRCKARGRS